MELPCVRISVRNLVEFILRSGDLDNRRSAAQDREAMLKGSKIHRKIQKQMDVTYQAEVSLKYESFYEDCSILVEGRADGIFRKDGMAAIDEIKGVYRDLKFLEEPLTVHEAQAKCYAYMYARDRDEKIMQVQMTYCNLETEEIRRFCRIYTREELEEWYRNLLDQYQMGFLSDALEEREK